MIYKLRTGRQWYRIVSLAPWFDVSGVDSTFGGESVRAQLGTHIPSNKLERLFWYLFSCVSLFCRGSCTLHNCVQCWTIFTPKHTKNRVSQSVYHERGLALARATVTFTRVPKSRAGRETETYRLPPADSSTFIILYLRKLVLTGFPSTGDHFFLPSCVPTNPPFSISSWIYNQFWLCKSGYIEMYWIWLHV